MNRNIGAFVLCIDNIKGISPLVLLLTASAHIAQVIEWLSFKTKY